MFSWVVTKCLAGYTEMASSSSMVFRVTRSITESRAISSPGKLDPDRALLVGRPHLDHVAPDAERPAREVHVVPVVLDVHEPPQDVVAVHPGARPKRDEHRAVLLGRAEAVDARHRGHDDDVPALEEGRGRLEAEPVDLLVDVGVLLDVGVGDRNVGLGLVVVVVAHEVLDGVLGEERAELREELRREGLVVGHDERRPVERGDDVRHREGLAGARDAEEGLVPVPALDALDQLGDGLPLIALGLEPRHQSERPCHRPGPRSLLRHPVLVDDEVLDHAWSGAGGAQVLAVQKEVEPAAVPDVEHELAVGLPGVRSRPRTSVTSPSDLPSATTLTHVRCFATAVSPSFRHSIVVSLVATPGVPPSATACPSPPAGVSRPASLDADHDRDDDNDRGSDDEDQPLRRRLLALGVLQLDGVPLVRFLRLLLLRETEVPVENGLLLEPEVARVRPEVAPDVHERPEARCSDRPRAPRSCPRSSS